MWSETARIEPVSTAAVSAAVNFQVPATGAFISPASGSCGRQVPVNGAVLASLNGSSAASSNTTRQRLSPPPPSCENRIADAPDGEVKVPTRSPTYVWSIPEPAAVLQSDPS